jgi:hypothetical protein
MRGLQGFGETRPTLTQRGCISQRDGLRCERLRDHAGLHSRNNAMHDRWSDGQSDYARQVAARWVAGLAPAVASDVAAALLMARTLPGVGDLLEGLARERAEWPKADTDPPENGQGGHVRTTGHVRP